MRKVLILGLATAVMLCWQLGLFAGGGSQPSGMSVAQAIDTNGDFHSGIDDGFGAHTGEKGNGGGGNGR
jgi:hypothetical protein